MAENSKSKAVKVIKKKISPYPIEGEMILGAVKVPVAITMVSAKGFVADLKNNGICQVGVHYECHFTLPQSRYPMVVHGKVFKTFDRSVDPKDLKKIQRMVEVLFFDLKENDKAKILGFMKAIGQN